MDEMPAAQEFNCSAGRGVMTRYGAHVLSWAPMGQVDALFVSRQAVMRPGTAIRGGVPVILPWFGPGRTVGMAPTHGFARTVAWTHVATEQTDEAVTVVHRLTEAQATSPWFPYGYDAVLTTSFGTTLVQDLLVTNTSTTTFSFEEALHTYLRVGDVRKTTVDGLDGALYVDKLNQGAVRTQRGPVQPTGPIDRVYRSPGPVALHDSVLGRTITVATTGAADTVVWNPWASGASALPDLADDEWTSMLCIETANVRDRAVELPPGHSHSMRVQISITPSSPLPGGTGVLSARNDSAGAATGLPGRLSAGS